MAFGFSAIRFRTTLGLCAGVALEFLPPETAARLFDKVKCLEPMFGDVGQARTNAAMLLMMIVTTSSRTCTKPTVVRRFSSRSTKEFIFKLLSQCLQTHNVSPHWQKERCHLYKSGNSLIMSQPNNFSIFCA